jgi:hypothetical protein
MTRRPATFVQADIARAARAAKQLGPEWRVEIEGGIIRLIQSPSDRPSPTHEHECDAEPQFARGLGLPP